MKGEPIDILCLCSWHGMGGAQVNAARLTRAFRDRGYSAALGFLFEREPSASLDVDDWFVVASARPRGPLSWLRFLRGCANEIARRRPRVAFGFHPLSNIVGALTVGSRPGCRFVSTQQSPALTQSAATGLMEAVLCGTRLYHANIAVSRTVAETYSRHSRLYRGRMTVVYNDPPTLPAVCEPSRACREGLGIAAGRPVLGCIGRLHEAKNFQLAIRAAEALRESHLYIAGEGPQGPMLGELARSLGMAHRVHFLGTLSGADVTRFYKAVDLILMPSLWEGYGLVMVEAMSIGTPVVASDLPVLREVGGEAAVYCGPAPEDWRLAIAGMDEVAKRRMISAGLKRAEALGEHSMVDAYLEVAGLSPNRNPMA